MADVTTPTLPQHKEEEFVYDKKITCAICDKVFESKVLKNSKARRIGSDMDMRPRFEGIDTLKYGACSCPWCGYTALHTNFTKLGPWQVRTVKEEICSKFKYVEKPKVAIYDYDTAIAMHKLALVNAFAKGAKEGEKAYLCLLISWLYRGQIEELTGNATGRKIAELKKHEELFYQQAYDGLQKAIATEHFPIMGLNESAVDFILSYMSYHFEKYELASKFISSVLTSSGATSNMKDRAFELKEMIMEKLHAEKEEA